MTMVWDAEDKEPLKDCPTDQEWWSWFVVFGRRAIEIGGEDRLKLVYEANLEGLRELASRDHARSQEALIKVRTLWPELLKTPSE